MAKEEEFLRIFMSDVMSIQTERKCLSLPATCNSLSLTSTFWSWFSSGSFEQLSSNLLLVEGGGGGGGGGATVVF